MGDAIGGGGTQGLSRLTPPISRSISDQGTVHVRALIPNTNLTFCPADAIVLYGDPRHNAVSSYNVGTATQDGIFVRPVNQSLSNFANKLQSYCNGKMSNIHT